MTSSEFIAEDNRNSGVFRAEPATVLAAEETGVKIVKQLSLSSLASDGSLLSLFLPAQSQTPTAPLLPPPPTFPDILSSSEHFRPASSYDISSPSGSSSRPQSVAEAVRIAPDPDVSSFVQYPQHFAQSAMSNSSQFKNEISFDQVKQSRLIYVFYNQNEYSFNRLMVVENLRASHGLPLVETSFPYQECGMKLVMET